MADLNRAREYMDAHARLLDRRRFELILSQADPDATLATLAAYANGDGGFGWALHPDLRSVTSQPVAAIHAFETLEEVTSATSPIADGLCDWLDSASLDDGGLPFALPLDDAVGSTPMWASADSSQSSLLITCAVCAPANRIADRFPVTGSPVVELNRAVALAMADGPAAGLAVADEIARSGGLDDYQYLHATRADLLRRLGRHDEARDAYVRAHALASTDAERRFLDRRLAALPPVG